MFQIQSPCRWSLTSCSKPSGGQRKDLAAWSLERVACFLDVTGKMDDLNRDVPPFFLVSSGRTQGTQTIKISISNRALFYAHCMELVWNYHGVQTTETELCPNLLEFYQGHPCPTFPHSNSPNSARLNCWSPLGTGELRFQRNWRCWILRVEPATAVKKQRWKRMSKELRNCKGTAILRDFTGQKDDLTRGSGPKYATSCLSSKQFDLSNNRDLVAYWLKFLEVSLDLKKNIHICHTILD